MAKHQVTPEEMVAHEEALVEKFREQCDSTCHAVETVAKAMNLDPVFYLTSIRHGFGIVVDTLSYLIATRRGEPFGPPPPPTLMDLIHRKEKADGKNPVTAQRRRRYRPRA